MLPKIFYLVVYLKSICLLTPLMPLDESWGMLFDHFWLIENTVNLSFKIQSPINENAPAMCSLHFSPWSKVRCLTYSTSRSLRFPIALSVGNGDLPFLSIFSSLKLLHTLPESKIEVVDRKREAHCQVHISSLLCRALLWFFTLKWCLSFSGFSCFPTVNHFLTVYLTKTCFMVLPPQPSRQSAAWSL